MPVTVSPISAEGKSEDSDGDEFEESAEVEREGEEVERFEAEEEGAQVEGEQKKEN